MGTSRSKIIGPNLARGVPRGNIADGDMLVGHVGKETVLLARRGEKYFAVSASCSHYGAPLAEGLMVEDTVRCPWHHACFSLRTGEALCPPAFDGLDCWSVEQRDGKTYVREKAAPKEQQYAPLVNTPDRVVIIGGGAAAFAAAQKLRSERFDKSIIMLSDDDAPPVDRPNLSKDYLAGNAPDDWLPLRPDNFYVDNDIKLRLRTEVVAIDVRSREVVLGNGSRVSYDRLLLAMGAESIRPSIPGGDQSHVHTLRSLADSRAIIEGVKTARCVVILGASFIGLEVAASLRSRGIETHVVAPERQPMRRILGPDIGELIRGLHTEHGVIFHLEETARAINGKLIELKGGRTIDADLVVAGIGVRPRIKLAQDAGLAIDRGVLVDAYLETAVPGIFAAGDIARWPEARSGNAIRVEHWVVAERQGQIAALNMLGRRVRYATAPFFWSKHYDTSIRYVGHADAWDEIAIDGDVAAKDCLLSYKRAGRVLALATINRDIANLEAELSMEQDAAGVPHFAG
ncbi:MAG: FAD-dependent oxidoreductase [Rhodoplanes sp.]